LQALPSRSRDVFFTPAFHRAYSSHGEGKPLCSIVSDGAAVLVIPGLKHTIESNGHLWDLQSCRVGCAGPLASDRADSAFLQRAWAAWAAAMTRGGAVAALFRLHPLIGNERWLPADAEIRDDRQVAVVDLTNGYDASWNAAASNHRNMVRKARALGVATTWSASRSEFEQLYDEAMKQRGADAELQFGSSFFAALWALPEIELVGVVGAGGLRAGAVIAWSPPYGHYLLAARAPGTGNYLMNLLIDAAIERGVELGSAFLYLGGGRSSHEDDSLLRFKRSPATRLITYRVARVPINEPMRLDLVRAWTDRAGVTPNWLLGYRQQSPVAGQRRS
jgi:hypothetical protein